MTQRKFFEAVLGPNRAGHVQFMTDQFQVEKWFSWEDPYHAFRERGYLDLRSEEDVWFSINLYAERTRVAENALPGYAVYMDADTCHPDNFRVAPSYVVESSEGRWQVYWVLDKAYSPEDIQRAARRIAVAHKHQGCDQSGWIPTKMLRAPGTTNTKYTIPYRVSITQDSGQVYKLAEIEEAYKDISVEKANKLVAGTGGQDNTIPAVLPRLSDTLTKLPHTIWHLYEEEVPEGGSWSSRMWALLMGMFQEGFTLEEAYVVAWAARCNKYHPRAAGKLTQQGNIIPERHNPEQVMWREVVKAHSQQGTAESLKRQEEGQERPTEPRRKPVEQVKADFLSDEERVFLMHNPTFVEEYVAWVATRTDSDERFQRTLAWQLLSCAYGDKGYFDAGFGPMNLNLWVLIMGGTTWSRKSTARSLMLRVLHAMEKESLEYTVDIGSDFTPEGLNKELAERDGWVSLIHRDEIHGFFREIFTKNYMSGAIERLTELYDGKVQVSIRANKDAGNKRRANTVFNMMGLGIFKHLSEVLTVSNFESGFLTRFVWCVVEEPPITEDKVEIKLRDTEYDSRFGDPKIDEWVHSFAEVRQAIGEGVRKRLSMTEMAEERFNDFAKQLLGLTDPRYKWDDGSPMGPSAERLRWSVLKCAALLAMHDNSPKIEYHHVLPAIAQAELWYDDLTLAVQSVAASDFQRSVQEVEDYIARARNNKRRFTDIYSHFAQHRTQVVTEWIEALCGQGRAKKDNKYVWLEYETEEDDAGN